MLTGATQALRTSTGITHAGLKHVVDCIGGELLPGVAHRLAPASPALPAVALGWSGPPDPPQWVWQREEVRHLRRANGT